MLTESKTRILAIDYGSKRIGIAISDPLRLFPSLSITILNNSHSLQEILRLIKDKNVAEIVLGIPEIRNNSNMQFVQKIMKFKTELELNTNLSVCLWDEQFTSKLAMNRIVDTIPKKSKRRDKSLIDAHSAAIILEEYLKNLNEK
jgi:putative Holliday junction resolvase